ncbi:hypothetical protein HETIRDRAFT_438326 [Heterobasidion irregulare TC 32-1]|uniref:L-serine ammonia-lyase n=1 Tax=Heterobasidion irregulare (strain TC 32-1) TaxID=747525 RepID=W4KIL9_HETIT|nr:uncharacterized protein HETIRDRAFT_438326 [Heterobasidion irregulare TC 32-1]ETW85554.1 hypothetical protein HETIRDRAFT_438326 [Heterobasidion irregulare TC 32-1]
MSIASTHSEAFDSKLWLETPLIPSVHISNNLGPDCSVYLKLENLQPSQSYKYRGLSLFVKRQFARHGPSLHVICASGGNAGLAAACATQMLHLKCTIYLPKGVAESTRLFLKRLGAELVIAGEYYLQAVQAAEKAVKDDADAVLVPAYDHPLLWEGHASMIDEIKSQLPSSTKPDAIFCSVGGGGLLGGIIVGCRNADWDDVPIITLETHGSSCFYQSVMANRFSSHTLPNGTSVRYDEKNDVKLVHIHNLTSKASSLGASEPSGGVVKMALERKGRVKCVTIPDELSMKTGRLFAEDHKMLVELACATTLAPAYNPLLLDSLVPLVHSEAKKIRNMVFIVCGGFKISHDEMKEYEDIVAADVAVGGYWNVTVDSENLRLHK